MVAVSATWDKAHDPLRTGLEVLSGPGGSAGLDGCLTGEEHRRSGFLFYFLQAGITGNTSMINCEGHITTTGEAFTATEVLCEPRQSGAVASAPELSTRPISDALLHFRSFHGGLPVTFIPFLS